MHEVRHDVVQQPLVVRDHQNGALRAAHGVHALRDDAQRVDVQAGIGLVQNGQLRLQHGHLQNLVALLFAAGKGFVHRAVHQLLVHVQQLQLLAHQRQEIHGVHFVLAAILADRVQRRAQEIGVADAGNLDGILKRQEHAFAGGVFGLHRQQVLAVEEDFAAGDVVALAARQHLRQRALARAVRAHDGVDFAGVRPSG